MASRWKRLAQNLVLSLGVFLLCAGAFELLLRLNGYGNLEIYESDPVLYWKLKPNQDCYTKVDHKPVHINSHGTRGPEFLTQKPANSFRILSLGDSRTFGWGLSESETYSGVLQNLLQKEAPAGKRIEVINAGVNAWMISFGRAVRRPNFSSVPTYRKSCVFKKMMTLRAARLYLRTFMQAFSIFFESCASTKPQSLDGGVKVFTFWTDA